MKSYTIKQIHEIQKKQNYKYLALYDQQGNAIIPFNGNAIKPERRLKEIETRFLSEALPDGNYFFKGKNSPRKNIYSDDYLMIKGIPENLQDPAPVPLAPVSFTPEVLTYDSALKMQVENERLKLENANLIKQVEDLEQELSEIEAEKNLLSEEKAPNLLDSGKAFLTEIVTMAAPLLDKHFELKEKQLSLQALAMQHKINMKRPTPEQAPQAKKNDHEQKILSVEGWIKTYTEDPVKYEVLANIYNTAENEPDFLNKLTQEAPDLFKEFQLYFN